MIYDGTGSIEGGTDWYLVVLGQYGAELVYTWWYWDSIGRNWLIRDVTGSVWCGTGWYLVVLVSITWY